MKPIKFKTKLIQSPGYESGWHFIHVEAKIGTKFEKRDGSRRVVCTINGTERFQCALLPWDGKFAIIVNKLKRTRLKIGNGDQITVELALDESKYGLPMPEELEEVLNQDPDGDKLFHSLTAGKQRSVLYFIGKIKDVDRRIHAALIFLEHLKKNDGKILNKELQSELKRPVSF
ncbi:MAG TPA: YdeI/OmpD-associated family protein [Pyrinomonadaceae bacterium]|nr:YdeI/OmpD-associated family protein [Pyrinomonadaceae bacterium]